VLFEFGLFENLEQGAESGTLDAQLSSGLTKED
jgi:hypothetical protein